MHRVLFFLLLCWAHLSQAQEVPRIINFTREDYGAHNQNWSIGQSNDNRVFFGNSRGLLSFDGAQWDVFPLPRKQIIRSVACDAKGNIFTGAFGEFGFWKKDARKDLVYHSLSKDVKFSKVAKEEIWHILVKEDYVLFQSFSTIYKYNYKEVTVLTPPLNIMFVQPVGNKTLLQCIGSGLYELKFDDTFTMIPGSQFLSRMIVAGIVPLGVDRYLIGTIKDGLYLYHDGVFENWNVATSRKLGIDQVNRMTVLANGQLVVGTILNGIYFINEEGQIQLHLNKENGLQNNTILSMVEDRDNNLWLGLDKGIDLIALNEPLTFYQDKGGKIGSVYTAVENQGKLYLGTNQGVFVRNNYIEKPGITTTSDPFRLLSGTQGQVWELSYRDGSLLCGHNAGTYDLTDGKVSKISDVTGGWSSVRLPKRQDVFLQGTYTGIAVFRKQNSGKWKFSNKLEGFTEPVKKIDIDARGDIWALNPYHQLFRLRLDVDLLKADTLPITKEKSPGSFTYVADMVHFGGQLILSTDKEFYIWDDIKQSFHPINEWMGVPLSPGARLIRGMQDDWFIVQPEMVELIELGRVRRFHLALVPDYEQIIALDQDRYMFCLDDGYAMYNRSELHTKDFTPRQPRIVSAEAVGKNWFWYPFDQMDYIFPSGSSHIKITYAPSDFTRKVRFRCKLEGLSDEWTNWDFGSVKEYTNLSPGKYTFWLASDNLTQPVTWSFEIEPLWYQSGWMMFFYFILLMLFSLLLMRWHQFRLERQHKHLLEEKQKELQQQEIKITNERLQVDVINKSKELANSTMNLIHKNEVLVEIKEELKDIKEELGIRLPEKYYLRLVRLIDDNLSNTHDWRVFETNFNQVHDQFLKNLKHHFTDLTPGDLRLAAYLKMNLSSKEIAPLLNISIRGVENKRYRLRKKMGLTDEANLTEFLMEF